MQLSKIPVKNMEQIIARSVGDGEILVFYVKRQCVLLEGAAGIVWKLINGKRDIKGIITRISEKHSGAKKEVEKYTIKALADLRKIKAIHYKK